MLTFIVPSDKPAAIVLPLGDHEILKMRPVSPPTTDITLPVSAFQRTSVVSYDPETKRSPLGFQAMLFTQSLCPRSVITAIFCFTFQIITFVSSDEEATKRPCGLQATHVTARLCPRSSAYASAEYISQIITQPDAELESSEFPVPAAILSPSELQEMLETTSDLNDSIPSFSSPFISILSAQFRHVNFLFFSLRRGRGPSAGAAPRQDIGPLSSESSWPR